MELSLCIYRLFRLRIKSSHKDIEYEQGGESDSPGDRRRDRPHADLFFRIGDAAQTVYDPIEAVIEVRKEERADRRRERTEHHIAA